MIDTLADRTLPRSMTTEWTELMFMQIRPATRPCTSSPGRGVRVSGAGGAVRKLVAAAGRDPGRADVPAVARWSAWPWPTSAINIFVQIGFVVLVGLACKNAILIVEFAKQLRDEGKPLAEATREACRLRLRPILMTSFAFILGVVPLVMAEGRRGRNAAVAGTAVFSGMLGVTLFGIFLTPVFFYVIEGLSETRLFSSRHCSWIRLGRWCGAVGGLGIGLLLWKAGIGCRAVAHWAIVGVSQASWSCVCGCVPVAGASNGSVAAPDRHAHSASKCTR